MKWVGTVASVSEKAKSFVRIVAIYLKKQVMASIHLYDMKVVFVFQMMDLLSMEAGLAYFFVLASKKP